MTALEKATEAVEEKMAEILLSLERGAVVPDRYESVARAVLMAVREPDDRMLKAAFVEMNRTPGGTWKRMKAENATPREMFDAKERPRFTAMIDAILNEETK